jgi:large subunit ribosomal protein L13
LKKYTRSFRQDEIDRKWFVVDAKDLVLGRVASVVAHRLRGKHNPMFTPNADMGDFIIVINADKVRLTGRKWTQKTYYRHSGYIGGLREITAEKLLIKRPEDLIRIAVKGMLPKNRIGTLMLKKLKIYSGDQHPHDAQQPETLTF